MKKVSVEERLIRSMGQAVEIAEGTTALSREYILPLTARRFGSVGTGRRRRLGRTGAITRFGAVIA